jgi:hypothetical protein
MKGSSTTNQSKTGSGLNQASIEKGITVNEQLNEETTLLYYHLNRLKNTLIERTKPASNFDSE